jgi:hypothetical protein
MSNLSKILLQLKRLETLASIKGLRAASNKAAKETVFGDESFPQQWAFVKDKNRFRAALCTRRAGKSWACGEILCEAVWNNQNIACLYITKTREQARDNIWWDVLQVLDDKKKLGFKYNNTDLMAWCTRTNSRIKLFGIDSNPKEQDKILGQKYKVIIIDEVAFLKIDVKQLIVKLTPSLVDNNGSLILTSTPSNNPNGLFYDLTKDGAGQRQGYSVHTWSTTQNPYVRQQFEETRDRLIASYPGIEQTALFKQHYLGQWCIETDKLVYRYSSLTNCIQALPASNKWHRILGIDLGWDDPSAFVTCAYRDGDTNLYIESAEKQPKMDITAVANKIKALKSVYNYDCMIIDGANKQAVQEIINRHRLPLICADKAGKEDFIGIMNAEFQCSKIKLLPNAKPLADEYDKLAWNEKVTTRKEEDPGCDNHCADAALYAWRRCYQYLNKVPIIPTAEELKAKEVADMRRYAENLVKQQKQEEEIWR